MHATMLFAFMTFSYPSQTFLHFSFLAFARSVSAVSGGACLSIWLHPHARMRACLHPHARMPARGTQGLRTRRSLQKRAARRPAVLPLLLLPLPLPLSPLPLPCSALAPDPPARGASACLPARAPRSHSGSSCSCRRPTRCFPTRRSSNRQGGGAREREREKEELTKTERRRDGGREGGRERLCA